MPAGNEIESRWTALWGALVKNRTPVVTIGAALFLTTLFLVETTSFAGDYHSSPGAWGIDVFYNLLALVVSASLVGFAGYWVPVTRPVRGERRPATLTGRSGSFHLPSFRWVAAALLPFGIGLLVLGSRVASQSSCQEFSLEYPVFCPIPGLLQGVASAFTGAGIVAIGASVAMALWLFLPRRLNPRPRRKPGGTEST